MDGVRQAPLPVQSHVPIAIGASGEKKGLRIVAKHADIWHQWLGPHEVDVFRHKSAVLDAHLDRIGRPRDAIERHVGGRLVIRDSEDEARRYFEEQVRVHGWNERMTSFTWAGTQEQVIEWIQLFRSFGIDGFSPSVAAPLDLESIERLATEVRPRIDAD
jgi:alkanesulfonate monooxygenase SsuD/methylene tetrahydromethanopterin reductase-like flavin-dependent oxidoreductase (luciferase family)